MPFEVILLLAILIAALVLVVIGWLRVDVVGPLPILWPPYG